MSVDDAISSGPVYLDHAATAGTRPESVAPAVLSALLSPGNPGRSAHRASVDAARVVADARMELAGLIGASDPAHVVFTKGATEGTNLVLAGFLRRGDRVLCSGWEHNAVMRPLRHLEQRLDLSVKEIPTAAEGPLDLTWLDAALENDGARLVAVLDASNVTGEIMPIREVGEICRRNGVFLLVDAAQGGGLLVHDVEGSGVDALVMTGHKGLLGPPGTGAVYLREPGSVEPLIRGGTGSRSEEEAQPPFLPDRYEAGTANVPGIAGLAEGVRYLRRRGLKAIRSRVGELTALLIDGLASTRGVNVHGPLDPARRVGIVSLTVDGLSTSDAARALEQLGILCRPGLHCAPRAHRTLGTMPHGTVRLSLSSFTTEEEIRRAVDSVRQVAASR